MKFALRSNIDFFICLHFQPFPPRDDGCDNREEGRQLIISLCYWPLPLKFLLDHQTSTFPLPLNSSCLKNILREFFHFFPFCHENPWLYVLEKLDTSNKQEKNSSLKGPPYRALLELQIGSLTPPFLLPFGNAWIVPSWVVNSLCFKEGEMKICLTLLKLVN